MDDETRNFLQHIHDSLDRKTDATQQQIAATQEQNAAEFACVNGRLDTIERTIGTMNHAITHYGSHVELMLPSFAASHEMLDARIYAAIADLNRRVTALEQRQPPEAAA